MVNNPQRNTERYYHRIAAQSSKADQAILARPEMKAMLIENWLDAASTGLRGCACETAIFSRPWGLRLEDVSIDVQL
jgi:hypothetical protein